LHNALDASSTSDGAPVGLDFAETHGWRRFDEGRTALWFRGLIPGTSPEALARVAATEGAEGLLRDLPGLCGHFALAATGPGWALAAVDRVRSTPLFFGRGEDRWQVGPAAGRIADRLGLGPADRSPDGALAVAMAGYTIGGDTLYGVLEQLRPGEAVSFGPGGEARHHRYSVYRPWRIADVDGERLRRTLRDVTLSIFERLIASAGGRPIVAPLSAGLDSRLVVSALAHLGYRNVRCFAYGLPGNHEAEASRQIAAHLGYEWTFVPLGIAAQKRTFASDLFRGYMAYADARSSTPFQQDLGVLARLRDGGWAPEDAIVINGNSGDFISGAHIPPALRQPPVGLSVAARRQRVLEALYLKHFGLWQSLRTPEHKAAILARLDAEIDAVGAPFDDPAGDHGVYEFSECQDRQCKYVITGQRVYEYLGFDWRLPLWDPDYLDFWEGVPLEWKAGQRLYAEMLRREDWGGVWHDYAVNAKRIRPGWVVPLRWIAKAASAPAGRDRWHAVERRLFGYWMDNLSNSAIVPYGRWACDGRGARHALAWHTEAYLAGLGFDFAGRPAG